MRPTTNVYIDGFNLYYGLLARGGGHKWLNLHKLAQFLLPDCEIRRVRYFTAMVKARPDDPQKPLRQEIFLRAVRTLPSISVHFGYYQESMVWRRLVDPPKRGRRTAQVYVDEEKGSDVNLATMLLVDAYEGDCEMAAVLSNDSDLALPIEYAQAKLPHGVIVFNPHPGATAWRLKKVATVYRPIRQRTLRACEFTDSMSDEQGAFVKPESW